MMARLAQRLRHARPFRVVDPHGGWPCDVFMLRGDRDGTVHVTVHTPIPFERLADPSIRVTAAGAEPVEDLALSARDRRLSVALAQALTDPAQATHLAAAARRIERAHLHRIRWRRPGEDAANPAWVRHRVDEEVRTATVLLAALASPPEVRAVTLAMLAADPDTDPAESLTAARAAVT